MWQRFTERARRVVFFAQEEAARLGMSEVGPEHLLLGLVRENDNGAAQVLGRLGVPLGRVRAEVERVVTHGTGTLGKDMQLTPAAKKAIDCAGEEAEGTENNYIGTEQLLLGLLREGESPAANVLAKLGVELEKTRQVIQQMQATEEQPVPGAKHRRLIQKARGALAEFHDFVAVQDTTAEQITALLDLAQHLKAQFHRERLSQMDHLSGKTLAMLFEKPSLRTRVTFEVGMTQLGGHAIYLQPSDVQLGKRESVADAARNLDRWVDAIMARTFRHDTITELAAHSNVPVINGLSDLEHPCQALADFLTIIEKKGTAKGIRLAFVGDGNNVAHSLMLMGAKLGTHVVVACPDGYAPDATITAEAQAAAVQSGGSVTVVHDPVAGVQDADVIYTDVWASMGQEAEAATRAKVFAAFQVNAALVAAAKPDVVVMHCLPAHRGEEITDDVIDGPHSIVFDQAENRLHAQKAVLVAVM
jgi:ornithine carbamoyltransferase